MPPLAGSPDRLGRDWLPRTAASIACCRSCVYDDERSLTMTRSTARRRTRQYAWARSSWRTSGMSARSSMRTTTIGRSPEIDCDHRPDCGPAPRASCARGTR